MKREAGDRPLHNHNHQSQIINPRALDALIKAKQALDRPRDREVLRQLEAIRQVRRDKS